MSTSNQSVLLILFVVLAISQSDMFSVKDLSELHAKLDASWNGQPEDSKVRVKSCSAMGGASY